MQSYHIVAELRQFRGAPTARLECPQRPLASRSWDTRLSPAAIDLNVEVADLFAQRIAVEAEQVGGADLIAAGRRQRRGQQRHLDLLEDAVIEPRRRDA